MIFIAFLAYLLCTSYQQNDNPLISSNGHDIQTVMMDIKRDHPELHEKMKKEGYFDKDKVNTEEVNPDNSKNSSADYLIEKRGKIIDQINNNEFEYVETEDGKVFLVLN